MKKERRRKEKEEKEDGGPMLESNDAPDELEEQLATRHSNAVAVIKPAAVAKAAKLKRLPTAEINGMTVKQLVELQECQAQQLRPESSSVPNPTGTSAPTPPCSSGVLPQAPRRALWNRNRESKTTP